MEKRKLPSAGNALMKDKYRKKAIEEKSVGGGLEGIMESGAHNDRLNRFQGHQGHGFAAEQANTMVDVLSGRKAQILGDDNAKNGADRMVDGKLIQVKYGQDANASVQMAFRNGKYRYLDTHGKPMQLEIPPEQYDKAVELMERRIERGEVPGVTDPKDARKIIRKGNVTYRQAMNIAKAGTIESLSFDAAHGIVIASSAFGLTAAVTFAKSLWDGQNMDDALDRAMASGVQIGGASFVTSVMSAQLTRTGLNQMMLGPSIQVVKLLPPPVRHALVNATREGASIYGGAASNNLAKLLRSNAIATGVFLVVMSAGDISKTFQGKISGKQLFKNVMTLAGGVGGGFGGAAIGATVGGTIGSVIPGVGTVIGAKIGGVAGGVIGGGAGGTAANKALNQFIEDDAIKMVRILNERFTPLAQEYLLSEDELEIVLDDLRHTLSSGELQNMYASNDRKAYADDLIRRVIEKTTGWRVRIRLPSMQNCVDSIGRICEGDISGNTAKALIPHEKVDPVKVGEMVLGKTIPLRNARKALYVTKQMNLINKQKELCLQQMQSDERAYAEASRKLADERLKYKEEIRKLEDEIYGE